MDDLASRLKHEAASMQIPLAGFVRQTMEEKLAARAKSKKRRPLEDLIGILKPEDHDLAARVDEILDGKSIR